jgi:hypothetical protein
VWICADWGKPVACSRRLALCGLVLVVVFGGDTTARAARDAVRIDALTQTVDRLSGGGESGSGEFGYGVAQSANGSTALIGAPNDNGGAGAAWVFTRSGGTWKQQGAKLTGSQTRGGGFGSSVALAADGDTALIGSPDKGAGAAWVFTRVGGAWKQQGPKLIRGSSGGEFGSSVALSSDGSTALIGAPDANGGAGAAWVFTRSAGVWRAQGLKLTGRNASEFGWSVALSAGGSAARIGAPGAGAGVGAAWVLTRSGGSWKQGRELTGGSQPPSDLLGSWYGIWNTGPVPNATLETAVGIEIDRQNASGRFSGTIDLGYGQGFRGFRCTISGMLSAVVGGGLRVVFAGQARGEPVTFTGLGGDGVSIFGTLTWGKVAHTIGFETAGSEDGSGQFGFSVALSADGSTALIGGPFDNGSRGAAWIFSRSGGVWRQQASEPAGSNLHAAKVTGGSESATGEFGWSVALSASGSTALIGAPDNGAGAAWTFSRSRGVWKQQGASLTASGERGSGQFGHGVALSAAGTAALVGSPEDGNATGTAWLVTGT